MPQCWLSNSTAQAIAWIRVKPDVSVLMQFKSFHAASVTCLATSECFDWILGNWPPVTASIALYSGSFGLSSTASETGASSFGSLSFLSSSHRVLTPSIIFCTSWTSEYPSLCLLEMSYVCPVCPPDSPLVPLGWRWSSSHLAFNLSTPCAVQPGRSTWTDALIPVPRLVGHEWMYPYFASNMKSFPDSFRTDSWTALIPLASLSNTALTSPPFCIEMILNWSSSLTQMRNVFSSLWKIPLPSGQSLSMPATVRFLSPETNKKWSSTSCCLVASFIPVKG